MSCGSESPVAVVIRNTGEPEQIRCCLANLEKCLPPGSDVRVADASEPGAGVLQSSNRAIEAILPSGGDILLLDPSAEVTPGFLTEMCGVLYSHERHAVVSPRSNNAGIFSIPPGEIIGRNDAWSLWKDVKDYLPRFQTMPTCDAFCMLVRNSVLRTFGLFDPAYEPGYDAEHDFICRIDRFGYSAVAANRAFVFHDPPLEAPSPVRERNRTTLDLRYPEYTRKMAQYLRYRVHPVERFSSRFGHGRQRILFDLSHLPAHHCGTTEFALSLLIRLTPLLESRYDLYFYLSPLGKTFFAPELTGYKILDHLEDADLFDLVFKPCQVFQWAEWRRMVRHGARLAYTHMDAIAVRCDYLSGPNTRTLFRTVAESVDLGITISEFSKRDFERLYGIDSRFVVIHHGVHEFEASRNTGDFILIVGNSYPHKATAMAAESLRGLDRIVVLGADPDAADQDAGIRAVPSGSLSRRRLTELYDAAKVVVFPSFYEGFGLPVGEALAQGKPVVARDDEVMREVAELMQSPRLYLAADFTEMRRHVANLLAGDCPPALQPPMRSWRDAAADYARAFEALLSSPIDVGLLERRSKLMETLDSYSPF